MVAALLISTQVSAQFIPPPLPYYGSFVYGFAPLPPIPFYPPTPLFNPPIPPIDPYLAALPTISRGAAATIILTPTAPVVTAAAPLGTLALTPSSLVFLILILSLEE